MSWIVATYSDHSGNVEYGQYDEDDRPEAVAEAEKRVAMWLTPEVGGKLIDRCRERNGVDDAEVWKIEPRTPDQWGHRYVSVFWGRASNEVWDGDQLPPMEVAHV